MHITVKKRVKPHHLKFCLDHKKKLQGKFLPTPLNADAQNHVKENIRFQERLFIFQKAQVFCKNPKYAQKMRAICSET